MSLNSKTLNERGFAICVSCHKKFPVSDLETCNYCNRFVCIKCATFVKSGAGGIACKSCFKNRL